MVHHGYLMKTMQERFEQLTNRAASRSEKALILAVAQTLAAEINKIDKRFELEVEPLKKRFLH